MRCNYACPLTAGPESVHIPKMVLIMFLKFFLSSVVENYSMNNELVHIQPSNAAIHTASSDDMYV